MAAPKGNRFWEARAKHGRDKIFKTPEAMWEAACEYFAWVEDNPLIEVKSYQFQGEPFQDKIPKMRAMTIEGFCLFCGANRKYLFQFESEIDTTTEEGQGFSNVINEIKEIIRLQKFTGAAADLLNANIISRDLGLADKTDLTSSDGSMTPRPVSITAIDPTEAAKQYQDLMEGN